MRAMAYQQFQYQTNHGIIWLARQNTLFAHVPSNHFFQTSFQQEYGLSIKDFLLLALCLVARFNKSGFSVHRDYLFTLSPLIPPYAIDAFLRATSINAYELPETLRESDSSTRDPIEYLQQTPFIKFPLIRVRNDYWCIYPQILQRSLGHFIYDTLKQLDLQRFNHSFGVIFERYVGNIIKDAEIQFAIEADLIKALPGEGKVVDFLINDGEANIFIDAKGVEMAQRGQIAHRRDVVRGASQTSLIKAFEQGLATCARLRLLNDKHPIIKSRPDNYLIVVTYKELYIGNGRSLSAAIGEEQLSKIRATHNNTTDIPNENIYFLTIDEFEHLMALVKGRRINLTSALERAKKDDSDPLTRKFIFDMHIHSWPERARISSFLESSMSMMTEELRLALLGESLTSHESHEGKSTHC